MWYFMVFVYFISLINDEFMWMVHNILHSMFDYKENRLCWVINVATEAHGEILKIIASLDSDVYDSTNY